MALSTNTSKKTGSEQIITITGETQRNPERSKVTQLEATWAVFTLKSALFLSPYFSMTPKLLQSAYSQAEDQRWEVTCQRSHSKRTAKCRSRFPGTMPRTLPRRDPETLRPKTTLMSPGTDQEACAVLGLGKDAVCARC